MSVSPPSQTVATPAPVTSPSTTAGTALGVTGGTSILWWLFTCIQQHQMVMPAMETVGIIAAAMAPLIHAIYNAALVRADRLSLMVPTGQTVPVMAPAVAAVQFAPGEPK